MRARLLFWIALLAGAACSRQSGPPPGSEQVAPSAPPAASEPGGDGALDGAPDLTCQIVAAPSGANRHAVSLVVAGTPGRSKDLRYYHPPSFQLFAWVDDQPVRVREPPIDHPVEPRTLHVGPTGGATLSTPVALSFGPGSREFDQKDPHRRWIDHAPARVRLRATGAFDSPRSLACTGWLDPAAPAP
jgi:hypothetical protein